MVKNRLKNLLILLSVGVAGLTPIASVISCGTQKNDSNDVIDISTIQTDLQKIIDSKTNSAWELSELQSQKLGGDSEYKDRTLSELGIDIECLNPNEEINDDGLVEYNFQFTVNDSSKYLVTTTIPITLIQNVSISNYLNYSIYLDQDNNKKTLEPGKDIPDGAIEVLRLGTNVAGTSFVSIPNSVTKVTVGAHAGITSLKELFKDKTNLKYVDLTGLDTSQVTDMGGMFENCSSLKEIKGIENLNTSSVEEMDYLFYSCQSLKLLNLSSWDTSKVTNMNSMFAYCQNIESLDVSNFDTSKVTDMAKMFMTCQKLVSLDLSSFDISKATTIDYIFEDSYSLTTIIGMENWDMSSLTSYKLAFAVNYNSKTDSAFSDKDVLLNCPDLSNWTVLDSFDFDNFIQESKFDKLNNYDFSLAPGKMTLSKYIDADGNEQECYGDIPDGATEVEYLGTTINGKNFVSIPDSVTKVTVGSHTGITTLKNLFKDKSNLEYVDLTDLSNSNIEEISGMFANCSSLTTIIDFDKFVTANIKSLDYLFDGCSSLTTIDTTNWDTSKVNSMISTFESCSSLNEITGIEKVITSNCRTFNNLFFGCSSLTSLDLSNWITSKVTDITGMFQGCYKLESLMGVEKWDMKLLTSYSYSFAIGYDNNGQKTNNIISLNCPDLSDWTVYKNFDQSDFISSSKLDSLNGYDISKAPKN